MKLGTAQGSPAVIEGQSRGEFVSQSRRPGGYNCSGNRCQRGAGPGASGFGASVGISLVFGKREF